MTTSSYKRISPLTPSRPVPGRPGSPRPRGPVRRSPPPRPQRPRSPGTPLPRSPKPTVSPIPSPTPGPVVPGPRPGAAPGVVKGFGRIARGYSRPYGFVHDAYDIWDYFRQIKKNPFNPQWTPVPEGGGWVCGGPIGAYVFRQALLTKPLCGLSGQYLTNSPPRVDPYSLIFADISHQTGPRYIIKGIWASPLVSGSHNLAPNPTLQPVPAPFIPLLPNPQVGIEPGGARNPRPEPRPVPAPRHLRSRPPSKGQHERKGQIASGLGKAVAAAFAVTEGVDAVDAIWSALPKDIRRSTPKSGVARKGAFIGEGTRYSTPIDKALQIYRHYKSLDLSEAAKNLLINHFIDQIIGKMSAQGADKLRKQLRAAGWGNVI